MSAYQQHKSVLLETGTNECPRINILTKLGTQIQQWKDEGNQVMVVGDFNEDVRSSNIKQFLMV
jgi:hypothetical protein